MAAVSAGFRSLPGTQNCLVSVASKGLGARCKPISGPAVVTPAGGRGLCVFARVKRPVEERYGIRHEKNVTSDRLKELGVERWSKWECGPNVTYRHEWQVDELVYISKGSVMVSPEDCDDNAYFYQGDIVRFPKWLVADLTFDENYEQCYRFLAYGD